MREIALILRARLRIANNHVASIREHMWIHLFVFLGVIFFLLAGGAAFFHRLFRYLHAQEDFGDLLMDRLVGMVIMTFFSMLVFSNLIITLSTTYISRDVEYFMSQPVAHRSIFFVKLFESIVYSSWAFAILSLPLFISFGIVRNASLWFYVLLPVLILPFLIVPAGIGALMTMVLSALLPARRALKSSAILVGLVILTLILVVRYSGAFRPLFRLNEENFTQILNLLKVGGTIWLPHYWITRGMLALARADWMEFVYWFLMTSSTALMLLQLCSWLAPGLYYRGWCLTRESQIMRSDQSVRPTLGTRIFNLIERALSPLSPPIRALFMKDIKTFWRDPAQWSQLIILFGLLFLYIAHLRGAYYQSSAFKLFIPRWQVILSYFNMAATCFVLSILTTRFIYPMLSLEGKQFWTVGLAPIERTHVVWQKYGICWITSVLIAETLMIFSNWILRVPPFMMALSCGTIFFMTFGLTSLSVGLGAATPNFKEDNPARIANGLGGTMNVVLSLIYIGVVITVEAWPTFLYFGGTITWQNATRHFTLPIIALILVQLVATILPMSIGLRRWRQMEF